MSFKNIIPEWKNQGSEPSESLKTNGFQVGYKPPNGIFNWFWSKVSKAITELQTKAVVKGNLLNADLNEAIETGIYRFNVPVANKPPITYGQLLVMHGEGDTIAQIAFGYEGRVYYRAGNPSSVGGNGDWTEWYRIYDEKSTVPIAHGGTGATTAAGALSTLGAAAAKHKGQHNRLNGADPVSLSDVAYFGMNPIDFNDSTVDTVQNWVDKGSGYCYYAKEGDFGVQPSRYGQLVNLITGADVFQLWHTLPKGANYIRSGSGTAGWVSGWVKIYDGENKPTPNELGVDGLGAGTNIEANTDLDSLVTLGNYHCISNDVAASLANCPTKNAFTMKVRYGNGSAYYMAQEIVTLFSVTYRRTRNGDSLKWNEWVETYTSTNVPSPDVLGVADYIVEQGTSGIWTYEKWDSGKYNCWCTYKVPDNYVCEIPYGSFYRTNNVFKLDYPISFVEVPKAWLTTFGGNAGFVYHLLMNGGRIDRSPEIRFVSDNNNDYGMSIHLKVEGRWK